MKPPANSQPDDETLTCTDAAAWETWLAANHPQPRGIWLRIARKGGRAAGITIEDALNVALCYGWIDSHRRSHDRTHYLQRYSPRRARSPWSLLNVQRAEALIGEGRMQAAGLAEIAAARADGRWAAAYEPQRGAETPADVAAALAADPQAAEAFAKLSKSARYARILPLLKATTPEIRAKRLEKFIAALQASSER